MRLVARSGRTIGSFGFCWRVTAGSLPLLVVVRGGELLRRFLGLRLRMSELCLFNGITAAVPGIVTRPQARASCARNSQILEIRES